MGTSSRIAVANEDGSYLSVYCHWDGYPSHNGGILLHRYKDEATVRKLISMGDLSSLGGSIGTKHDFGASDSGDQCTFYKRDRGDAGVDAQSSGSLEELFAFTQDCGGEWLYVFDHGTWLVGEVGVSMFGLPASAAPTALTPLASHPDLAETSDGG